MQRHLSLLFVSISLLSLTQARAEEFEPNFSNEIQEMDVSAIEDNFVSADNLEEEILEEFVAKDENAIQTPQENLADVTSELNPILEEAKALEDVLTQEPLSNLSSSSETAAADDAPQTPEPQPSPTDASPKEEVATTQAEEQLQPTLLTPKQEESTHIAPVMTFVPSSKHSKIAPVAAPIEISLKGVFDGSPIIYSVLLAMSVFSFFVCLYNFITLHRVSKLSEPFIKTLKGKLTSNQYDEALFLCAEQSSLFSKMLASGITARRHGLPVMIETMKAEGKRISTPFWQRAALLNDVAIIAPMIGLLGTVLGMFYAFYNLNRSTESISTLFDGLGISVGTTVAGLIVAIVAMMFHSFTKYRLIRQLAKVESEAHSFATLLDDHSTLYPK